MQANVKKVKEEVVVEKIAAPVVHIWTESRPKKVAVIEQYHQPKAIPLFNNERIFRCRKYDFL